MKTNFIICTFLLLGLGTSLLGQNKGLHVGGFLAPGLTQTSVAFNTDSLQYTADNGIGLRLNAELAYFFTEKLGIGTGLGFGRFSGGVTLSSDFAYSQGFDQSSTPFTTTGDSALAYQLNNIIKQGTNDQISMTALEIPILFKFRNGGFFIDAGPVISLGLGSPSLDGSNTYTQSGKFTWADGQSVTITDVPSYGFETDAVAEGNTTFESGGVAINFLVNAGYRLPLDPKQNSELRFGVTYMAGGGQISGMMADNQLFSRGLQEQNFHSLALSDRNERVSFSLPGVFLGYLRGFDTDGGGGGGGRTPCQPDEFEGVPVVFNQSISTRRETRNNDPEFEAIIKREKEFLNFKNADWNPANNQVLYCPAVVSPQSIGGRFPKKNQYLDYKRDRVQAGRFEIELTPKLAQKSFSLDLQDGSGNPINNFQARLTYKGTEVASGTYNSGQPFAQVYDDPDITYVLELSHDCYEAVRENITSAKNLDQPVRLVLRSSGNQTQLTLPVDFARSGAVTSPINVNGEIQLRNGRSSPVSGTLDGRNFNLSGGCGINVSGDYQVMLQKPRGYDVYQGTNSDWKTQSATIGMRDEQATSRIRIDRLPTYNMFYADISEITDRQSLIAVFEPLIEEINRNQDELLLYVSNSQSPEVIAVNNDFESFFETIAFRNTDLPTANFDRQRLAQELDPQKIVPERRIVVYHMFLSNTIHKLSRELLVEQFLEDTPEEQRPVELRIYTEEPIPASDQVKGEKYNVKITYIPI